MTQDALARLLELADKATPGPWIAWAGTHFVIRKHSGADRSEDLRICEVAYNSRNDESRYNTAYIAACSPEVVAALVRVVFESQVGGRHHTSAFASDCQICIALDALDAALAKGTP